MFKILALALLVGCASAADIFQIAPRVEGVIQCGGDGNLIGARVPGCTVQPCHVIVGNDYNVEIDFTTGSTGSDGYKLKIVAIGQTLLEADIQGNFLPNTSYTVSYIVTASDNLVGLTVTLRATVERLNDDLALELCGEIRVRVTATEKAPAALPFVY